jgi:hypothetical protein
MKRSTWDRATWFITNDNQTRIIETERGTTWALRALIAAGSEGLRPIDTAGDRWRFMIDQLRALGVPVRDLEPDQNGRRGYALACKVKRAGDVTRTGAAAAANVGGPLP